MAITRLYSQNEQSSFHYKLLKRCRSDALHGMHTLNVGSLPPPSVQYVSKGSSSHITRRRCSQRTDAASSLARCKTFINGASLMAVQGVFTVEGNFASSFFLNLSTLYLIILWTIQINTCSSKSAEEINNARFLNMRSLIPSWSWVHSEAYVNVPNSFPYHLHWRVGS